MKKLPAALVVVDICKEEIAVREATKLHIPVVAIVDTNADIDQVEYPIVANDDAVRSIKVIVDVIAESISYANEIYARTAGERKAAEEAAQAARAAEQKDEQAAPKKRAPRRGGAMGQRREGAPRRTGAPKAAGERKPAAPADAATAPAKEGEVKSEKPKAAKKPEAKKQEKPAEKKA
jgi:small subunit ribosomal protein S2